VNANFASTENRLNNSNMGNTIVKITKVDHKNIQEYNYDYLKTIITNKSYLDLKVPEITRNAATLTYLDTQSDNPGVKTISIDPNKLKPVYISELNK
jgi:hypothetical protein